MNYDAIRRFRSTVVVWLSALAVVVALLPLAAILFFVLSRGLLSLNFAFFTNLPAPVGEPGGGMANAIIGTLMLIGIGALFAVPIGVISGVYAAEFAGTKLATAVQFAADTLNGVPSIVIGVFVYGIAVLPVRQFSALAGGLALGVMMIPIITHDRGTGQARADVVARRCACAGRHPGARDSFSRAARGGSRHHHRDRAGARPHRRRDGAAAVHGVQQPILLDLARSADFLADGPGLHLRHLAV